MFTSKEAYVREIAARLIASYLSDEESLKAVYFIMKAYREQPNAFSNFRSCEEPIDIASAFQWEDTDPAWFEFWQKVNEALVDEFYNTFGDEVDGVSAEDVAEAILESVVDEDADEDDEEVIDIYDAKGAPIKLWGLFNKADKVVLPTVFETRDEARECKDSGETVVPVILFAIEGK